MTTELMTVSPEQEFLDKLLALGTDRLFVHVELDRLKVDPRYQRRINMQRVRKLAANFDENLMGVLVCSVRPDGVFVIDGQHRLEVARLLGHPTIRCELRVGLTLEQEANIFYNLDTARVGLSGEDGFRALLVAEDPTALLVKDAIEKAGLKLAFSPIIGGVRAFKTLLSLTRQHGIGRVQDALTVLGYAWHDQVNPAPAAVLEGLVYFLGKYPETSLRELGRVLAAHTSGTKLMADARAISGSLSWSTKIAMARAILHVYNYRRTDENRLPDILGFDSKDTE